MGVNKSWISRLHSKAINRVRQKLAEIGILSEKRNCSENNNTFEKSDWCEKNLDKFFRSFVSNRHFYCATTERGDLAK
jgi:hypothetical protein